MCLPPNRGVCEQPAIKLGVVLPLSGPIAWVGNAMRTGIEMAANDPQLGPIQLIIQDDLSSNRNAAVSIVKSLTAVHKVDAVLNCSTTTLAAITPVITQSKTPLLVIWDSNRDMTSLSPFAVGFGYLNEQAAEEAADFLIKTKGARTLAVLSYVNDWSSLLTRSFVARAKALGAEIAVQSEVDGEEINFKNQILRIRQHKVDGVYLPLYGAGLLSALKQLRQYSYQGTVLTVDSLGDQELKASGSTSDGIYVSQIVLSAEQVPDRSALKSLSANTSVVERGYTALGYDAVTAIASAIRDGDKKRSGADVVSALKSKTFTGNLGAVLINRDRIAERTIPIVQVKDGAFQLVTP